MLNGSITAACFSLFVLASSQDQALDRLRQAQSSSRPDEILKIARQFADEILTAKRVPGRLTAAVVGLYRKAEALKPDAIEADDAGRIGRLYLLLSESYADEAKIYLERTVAQTGRPEDRVALGNALLYLGDAGGARREYLEVSKRWPQDAVLMVNLALAERALGDTASAFGRLRQAALKTTDPSVERAALLSLADIQLSSNDVSGAKIQILKILRKWPGDAEAAKMLKDIKGDRK